MNISIRKIIKRCSIGTTILVLGLSATAQADHLIVCASIDGLGDALTYLEFTKDKDLVGLQGKLSDASDKMAAGKECDAAQKLKDFRAKLDRLVGARKSKVSEPHEGTLMCLDTGSQALVDEWDDGTCTDKQTGPRGRKN